MDRAVGTSRTQRFVVLGVVGGLAGSIVMAMYAMVVSAVYKDVGLLTPLYHIGSAFDSPQAMMTSMEAAAAGDAVTLVAGTALIGLLVHLVTGAAAGAVFGVLISRASLRRVLVVAAGAAFGLMVMIANALVGLPVAAALFGGGEAISGMPAMAGWGTFVVEHLMYGAVLGAVVARAVPRHAAAEQQRPQVTVSR